MEFNRFIPISKKDDEQRMVWGWASTPDLDSQGEVVAVEALEKALPEYMKFPTIREMHMPKAAGTMKESKIDKERGLYIGAKIIDRDAWEKVKEGVYRGFSIGGRVLNMIENTINDIELIEISLVDRPANANAVIEVYKRGETWEEKQKAMLANLPGQIKLTPSKGVSQMGKKTKKLREPEKTEEVEKTEVIEKVESVEPEKVEEKQPDEVEKVDTTEKVEDQPSETPEKTNDVLERLSKVEELLNKESEEVELTKFEQLETSVEKVASILERLADRVAELEKQPAQPKTKASFIVEKSAEVKDEKENRLDKINKRLAELEKVRANNLEKFQAEYMQEAQDLMDEKYRLLR